MGLWSKNKCNKNIFNVEMMQVNYIYNKLQNYLPHVAKFEIYKEDILPLNKTNKKSNIFHLLPNL